MFLLWKALDVCLQEQLRLKAQVRLLEQQTKLQQIKIENLLRERELQFMDRGDDMLVINLGETRSYAGKFILLSFFFLIFCIVFSTKIIAHIQQGKE